MTPANWMAVWTTVTVAGLGVFVVMSVWVAVGGLADIRALFAALDRTSRRNRSRKASRAR